MSMKTNPSATKTTQEPQRFRKRLGSTIFHVAVYSNLNAKETAGDKIARLIRNEVSLHENGGVICP